MNREDVAMDVTVQNVEILRGRLEQVELALAGMLFAFDDGVGQTWSADVLDFARQLVKAKEFDASQHEVQCISDTGNCGVGGYCAECQSKHPEQAEGAQGERQAFEAAYPDLISCVRWNEEKQEYESGSKGLGWQDGLKADQWLKVWKKARAALAQPSPAPDHFTHADKKLEALLNATALVIESPGHDAAHYWAECMREYDEAHSPEPELDDEYVPEGIVEAALNDRQVDAVGLAAAALAPEMERPEVVAIVRIGDPDYETGANDDLEILPEDAELRDGEALIRLTDFDRIVGALRADRDSWEQQQQAADRVADWDAMRQERDAAQARVAEVWKPSAELLREVEALGCDIANCAGTNNRTGARDKIDKLLKLLATAPVAQAGQVPDALILAEQFIAGFEDDESQEGVGALLASIRAAIGGAR